MQRIIQILFLLLSTATLHARQFGVEWMSAPQPEDSSAVWFRRTFVADKRPLRATVSVAATGRFVLYVNGRNVSTALYMPQRGGNGQKAVETDFDVTRFMRRDSNTVAVLLAPEARPNAANIAVAFHGTYADGSRFAHSSVDGWLCLNSPTRLMADGNEAMDGRDYNLPPAYGDMFMPQWKPAVAACLPPQTSLARLGMSAESIFGYSTHGYNPIRDNATRPTAVLQPRHFDINGRTVTYDFSPGFYGFVRVTLRGCRRGERINVGGMRYICSGEMDEQAFTRFSPHYARRVEISGDRHFKPEQIQEVEAICL